MPACVHGQLLAMSGGMTDGLPSLPSRPMLNRALRRVWRDQQTLQLGIEPRHAVVLRGVGRAEERVLELLDGSREVDRVVADAADLGIDELSVRRLLQMLARARVLDDGELQPRGNERDRQRLAPDAMSIALLDRTPGAATRALRARADATVAVHGAGRIGATLVALLTAAGVGRGVGIDEGPGRAADRARAGAEEPDGTSRAASAVVRATARYGADRVVTKTSAPQTLAIVAPVGCMPVPEVVAAVRGVPHLFVHVRET